MSYSNWLSSLRHRLDSWQSHLSNRSRLSIYLSTPVLTLDFCPASVSRDRLVLSEQDPILFQICSVVDLCQYDIPSCLPVWWDSQTHVSLRPFSSLCQSLSTLIYPFQFPKCLTCEVRSTLHNLSVSWVSTSTLARRIKLALLFHKSHLTKVVGS